MTAEEAKVLKNGERVVARYVGDNVESRGEVFSNDERELVILWDLPKGMRTGSICVATRTNPKSTARDHVKSLTPLSVMEGRSGTSKRIART